MYLVPAKACIVDALQTTFASSFIDDGFQGTTVSMEYPMVRQNYPGIWCNYDDSDALSIVGIGYTESVWDYPNPNDPTQPDPNHVGDNAVHEVTRWSFAGQVTLTFVALSSLERDNLYDQFIRVFAFSRLENAQTDFRTIIENNDFIGMYVNWDELRPHGDAASPGTPWGSEDEVIYEKSVSFDVAGEFVSDPVTNELVLLSSIVVIGTPTDVDDQPDGDPYVLGIPREG